MKKSIALFMVSILCLSLCACGRAKIQQATFGAPTEMNDFELTVNNGMVTATQLNGDEDQFEEFLTTDLTNYGDTTPCDVTIAAKEGRTMLVVPYTIKNKGKSKKEFDKKIILKYNNEYEYEANELYWNMGSNDGWHKFTSLEINPLSSIMCKALFTLPQEVINDTTASIKLIIANQEYTIR